MPENGSLITDSTTSRSFGGDSQGTFAGRMLRAQMGNFRIGYITENGKRLSVRDVLDFWIPKIEEEARNAGNLPSLQAGRRKEAIGSPRTGDGGWRAEASL